MLIGQHNTGETTELLASAQKMLQSGQPVNPPPPQEHEPAVAYSAPANLPVVATQLITLTATTPPASAKTAAPAVQKIKAQMLDARRPRLTNLMPDTMQNISIAPAVRTPISNDSMTR